jgi:hypothetical protein
VASWLAKWFSDVVGLSEADQRLLEVLRPA